SAGSPSRVTTVAQVRSFVVCSRFMMKVRPAVPFAESEADTATRCRNVRLAPCNESEPL
ncbi:MAG: hypothetical protein QOE55_2137, partial [Acidobacteriaceae bacterium]|nr:hypothetical protein [Acidobacteriaceae bacterium]